MTWFPNVAFHWPLSRLFFWRSAQHSWTTSAGNKGLSLLEGWKVLYFYRLLIGIKEECGLWASHVCVCACLCVCVFLRLFKGKYTKSLAKGITMLLESLNTWIQAHIVTQSSYPPPIALIKSYFSLCEYFNIIPFLVYTWCLCVHLLLHTWFWRRNKNLMFIMIIASCWIDNFIITNCPSLSLEIIFILKSVLSDINIVIWLSFDYCLHVILALSTYLCLLISSVSLIESQ